ncbi:ABC transporter substrate-binding protein [Nocardioides sp. GY 10127]|nr:ABC transporter substrate-binding protein [Nocardioides sp. GY 10127]
MWSLMYDSLVTYTQDDMSPSPGLASSWDSSEDGLTWTFHLDDGVTWNDGEPLTSADVVYTFDRILNGTVEKATWGSYLRGVSDVSAPDDDTVVLTFTKPSAVMPLLPIPILPEHVWSDVSSSKIRSYANEPTDGQAVVGSGPFELVDGTAGGSTYTFEANPDYWQGAPHVDELVYRVYKSEDPAVQALIKGEVDYVSGISALQVDALSDEDGITAHNADSPGFDEISFNAGSVDLDTGDSLGDPNPAVLDPAFRYAIGLGIDRQQLVDKVYQGAGQVGSTIIPPAYTTFHWEPDADDLAYDPDEAGTLLDEAGYTMGDDGLRTLPDGSPIGTLRLYARSDSQTSVDTMTYFKEWLADLGIESTVKAVESSKLTDVILSGEFDAFQWGWYVEPDPDSMLSYMTCDQRGNWSDSWYCDAEYDKLYEQQRVTTDRDERAAIVQKMQQILFEDAPYLVTAYNTVGEAVRTDRFACFEPQPAETGVWLFGYGVANYLNMRPVSEASDCADDPAALQPTGSAASGASGASGAAGLGTGAWVGGGVVLVLLVAGGAVLLLRRRAGAEDRE